MPAIPMKPFLYITASSSSRLSFSRQRSLAVSGKVKASSACLSSVGNMSKSMLNGATLVMSENFAVILRGATQESRHRFRREALGNLYFFADAVQDQDFSNSVMDAFLSEIEKMKWYPTACIGPAWENLPPVSPMRKYLKEFWVTMSRPEWYSRPFVKDYPLEFWMDVAELSTISRQQKVVVPKPSFAERCRYHYHENGLSCTGG